jgi:copper homeostasis protein
MRRMLEICAETPQACLAANEGGADRIELCSALIVGGLTPSHALIREATDTGPTPVYVLLRPRGGDFLYSDAEFRVICHDMEHAAALGVAGFVVGILNEHDLPNVDRMSRLVKLAGSLEVTFHRAFDLAASPSESLERIIDTGCRRLLTSGGAASALEGLGELTALSNQASGRIRIAAGGGVGMQTAEAIIKGAAVDLHASLRAGVAWGLGGGDPLWDDAARPVNICSASVHELAELVHLHPLTATS